MRYETLPFTSPTPQPGQAEAIVEALDRLPRPVVLQCASGNRAGAVMMLWLAKKRGYTAASAQLLAKDLDLKFFTRCERCGPMRDWLAEQLPASNEDLPKRDVAGAVVQQLFDPVTSTFTYLVGCKATNEALLIDPVCGTWLMAVSWITLLLLTRSGVLMLEQISRDLKKVDELGFKLSYVLNTHVHADHITSGGLIRKEQPSVRTVISEDSTAQADVKVKHGDTIKVGEISLEVRATPGHTAGCMSYVLRPSSGPAVAFAGDALLVRGCGRTDFQQGSPEQSSRCPKTLCSTLGTTTRAATSPPWVRRNSSTHAWPSQRPSS